jgi:hypothetical protein
MRLIKGSCLASKPRVGLYRGLVGNSPGPHPCLPARLISVMTHKNKLSEESPARYRTIAIVLGCTGVVALLIALLSYLWWFRAGTISHDSVKWGTFGDYVSGFGGTIVALATLIAVVYALDLQDRELSATRSALTRQLFDTRFFQLLQRFTQTSESVPGVSQDGKPLSGREAIRKIYEEMKSTYPIGTIENELTTINHMFQMYYNLHEPSLGPYFRTLYHVFKLVDHQGFLSPQEKIDYANIARAQLSRFELALLFYDVLTSHGTEFKPLVEKYGILKHLNAFDLADANHKSSDLLYSPTAFMSQAEREEYAQST